MVPLNALAGPKPVVPKSATPKLMGIKEYARHRGVSAPAVRKAIKEGRIKQRRDKKIHAPSADEDWAKNTSPHSTAPDPPGGEKTHEEFGDSGPVTVTQARAMKEAYIARTRRLEYLERTGRLIDRDLVRREQFNILRTVRDRMLEIPDRLADDLAAERDPVIIDDILRTEIRGALTSLAEALRAVERDVAAAASGSAA